MDPITALGAIAAASQLAQQCLYLTSLITSIKSSQTYITQISQHVTHLTYLSHRVISNPGLQIRIISQLLSALLAETRSLDESLRDLVVSRKDGRARRWLKGVNSVRRREVLEERVHGLERMVSLLGVAIGEVNA